MGCFCGLLAKKPLVELGIELGPGIIFASADNCALRKKIVDCATASFAGSDHSDPEGTLDWVLGPQLAGKWNDPRRLIMMEWCMRMGVSACLDYSGGFILAAPLETGELGAVLFVVPNLHGNPSKVAKGCLLLNGVCKNGLPPFKQMGDARKGIEKRFDAFSVGEEVHHKHASGPHLYVVVMAVHPDAQGQGLCGKLMRQVNVYADKLKLPLYLETSGEKNVNIYRRFGYEVAEQFTMECKKDPDRSEPNTNVFAMMRPTLSS
jgi:ribosomal protein S18 acetylase RimI-like enzyme